MLQKTSTHWIDTVTEIFFLTLIINISINEVRLITRKEHYSYNQGEEKMTLTGLFLYISLKAALLKQFCQPSCRFWVLRKISFFLVLSAVHLSLHRNTTLIHWHPPIPLLFIKEGERKAKIAIWILTGSIA